MRKSMLTRLTKIQEKEFFWCSSPQIYKPAPRARELQEIAGVYKVRTSALISRTSEEYEYFLSYFESVGLSEAEIRKEIEKIASSEMVGRLKLGKFFRRISPNFSVDNFLWVRAKEIELCISVRYNDILRCSETKNYTSCYRLDGCNYMYPARILTVPEIAVAFVRDKSGKFSSRVFLYLVRDSKGNPLIVSGRPYGEDLNNSKSIPFVAGTIYDQFHGEHVSFRDTTFSDDCVRNGEAFMGRNPKD